MDLMVTSSRCQANRRLIDNIVESIECTWAEPLWKECFRTPSRWGLQTSEWLIHGVDDIMVEGMLCVVCVVFEWRLLVCRLVMRRREERKGRAR